MKTEEELLRSRRYSEALGNNYENKPYHILLFKGGYCVDNTSFKHLEIKKQYATREESKRCCELMNKRNNLPKDMRYVIWNNNSDWL